MKKKEPDAEGFVLEVSHLEFGYDRPLLSIDQFALSAGERMAVLGPSGCGKTTFMHLITGLLHPDAGSIRVMGNEIAGLHESELDRIRGRHIGIVFQRLHLMPAISVIDNLLLAQRLARVKTDRNYAAELLAQLGIGALAASKPKTLSQGQAQRVAIARALAHRPSLLIADEPTSALDDSNAEDAMSRLQELTASMEAALVIVTHDERVRSRMDQVFHLESLS